MYDYECGPSCEYECGARFFECPIFSRFSWIMTILVFALKPTFKYITTFRFIQSSLRIILNPMEILEKPTSAQVISQVVYRIPHVLFYGPLGIILWSPGYPFMVLLVSCDGHLDIISMSCEGHFGVTWVSLHGRLGIVFGSSGCHLWDRGYIFRTSGAHFRDTRNSFSGSGGWFSGHRPFLSKYKVQSESYKTECKPWEKQQQRRWLAKLCIKSHMYYSMA